MTRPYGIVVRHMWTSEMTLTLSQLPMEPCCWLRLHRTLARILCVRRRARHVTPTNTNYQPERTVDRTDTHTGWNRDELQLMVSSRLRRLLPEDRRQT